MLVTLRTLDEHRATLLADVALICIESMYHDSPHLSTHKVNRAWQITEIARDMRLTSRSRHTQRALIDDVMAQYGVTYSNAKTMIHKARKNKEHDECIKHTY